LKKKKKHQKEERKKVHEKKVSSAQKDRLQSEETLCRSVTQSEDVKNETKQNEREKNNKFVEIHKSNWSESFCIATKPLSAPSKVGPRAL